MCCIISDSTRVLRDIKLSSLNKSPHPYLINSILNLFPLSPTGNFLIKWVPGHCNIEPLLIIDNLAKLATTGSDLQPIPFTKHEALMAVDEWICEKMNGTMI